MIHELLQTGKASPIKGEELAKILGVDIRKVTAQIEKERREGWPICASMRNPKGYYLAANRAEIERFCNQLRSRAGEIFKTRRALLDIVMPADESE